MKTYVSYVIQEPSSHTHRSEIVVTDDPLYSFSADPQVYQVLKWSEEKKKRLRPDQELVITGMYKI